MSKPAALKKKWTVRTVLMAAGTGVWLCMFIGVAIPAWQKAVVQHREVQALEIQLAELDRWSVAGLWLEKSLEPRRQAIDPQWQRLFPAQPAKGEFFLDLARVADQSGVKEFELRELKDQSDLAEAGADSIAGTPMLTYRVRASFSGQYAQVAEFLGGLRVIERAVSVHNLAIKPTRGAVQVDLELDVYVSATDQS